MAFNINLIDLVKHMKKVLNSDDGLKCNIVCELRFYCDCVEITN